VGEGGCKGRRNNTSSVGTYIRQRRWQCLGRLRQGKVLLDTVGVCVSGDKNRCALPLRLSLRTNQKGGDCCGECLLPRSSCEAVQ